MSSSEDRLWNRFWKSLEGAVTLKPNLSVVVELKAAGVNWPESFKASVTIFSRENFLVGLVLESGEARELDLRGFCLKAWSAPKPKGVLVEWEIAETFRFFRESEEFFGDVTITLHRLRDFGRKV